MITKYLKQFTLRAIGSRYLVPALAILLTLSAGCQPAAAQVNAEFPLPAGSKPYGITTGPDGHVWFVESGASRIGFVTEAGAITSYPTLTPSSNPQNITVGPDGALWFTELDTNKIGRITTGGVVSEYPILTTPDSQPNDITTGPDGALWFTEYNGNKIGRITTGGTITEYPITTTPNSQPYGIRTGPDGALWFTEFSGNKIGRITTAGTITNEFPITTVNSGPIGITTGPDGALWFAEYTASKIGRITTAGVVTNEYATPTNSSNPTFIITGTDGALWFTEGNTSYIGRITTAGVITNEYATTTASSVPTGITTGPDGQIWFTEYFGPNIGRLASRAITEYPVSTVGMFGITAGPDGALWFIEGNNKVGRITTAGTITNDYPITTPSSGPRQITAGPDGALWLTEALGNNIGRMTTAGGLNEYVVPTPNSNPQDITVGPDGALWFTENSTNSIGRADTAGVIVQYAIPTPNSGPQGITAGPDGALWFTEIHAGQIGRITTAGVVHEYPIPGGGGSEPRGITAGPDGALWFTENFSNKIGRMTTTGGYTEYVIPHTFGTPIGPYSGPYAITVGPDGALWFTEEYSNQISRITTAGDITITQFPVPTTGGSPVGITTGSDGALWFTEFYGNKVGRLDFPFSLHVSSVANIASTGKQGGPFTPASFQYHLKTGVGSIGFSISGVPNWLTASISSGTATTAPTIVTFTVNATANTLAPGTYGPVPITFTSKTNGIGTQVRYATLVVTPPTTAAAHDFNGDGKSDVVFRNTTTGGVAMWLMNGSSVTSNAGVTGAVAGTPWQMAGTTSLVASTGDFNGDGKTDILFRNTNTGGVAMWLMNGSNVTLNTGVSGAVAGLAWQIIGVGDFNGDGKADILWRNPSTGAMAMWLMNGSTVTANVGVSGAVAGTAWQVAGIGDFNGDGKADILWRNPSTGGTAMWLMNGSNVTANAGVSGAVAGTAWQIVGVGDFDGDGKADVLFRNGSTGGAAMWLMNGSNVTSNAGVTGATAGTAWQVVSTGDYNGDGKSDVLFRNTSTGGMAMWLMNGSAVTANTGVSGAVAGLPWTVVE